LNYFEPILNQIHVPIYLYNNPETFGGTEIAIETVNALKKFPHFVGLKDSSGSDDQKKIYLTAMTDNFTISCGKEGALAKFLTYIPKERRKIAGIIPSISNLVNTCARIFDLGIAGKDAEMLHLQDDLNAFRDKIYDSAQSKGKAQRGTKIAFAHLYKDKIPDIPTDVNPSLKRNIEPETVKSIIDQTDLVLKLGHITKI
jgi:dihydrodipicolinate synthase/N-acetylneuraminate lyase